MPLCREVDFRQKISATGLRFYSKVTKYTLRENKLRVPKDFVEKYGLEYGKLPNQVYFDVVGGGKWRIQVTKHDYDDRWFFDKGWEEFSTFYLLKFRDHLFFQYERNSRFKVLIFYGKEFVEIDYPMIEENDEDDQFQPRAADPMPQKKDGGASSYGKTRLSAERRLILQGAGKDDRRRKDSSSGSTRAIMDAEKFVSEDLSARYLVKMASSYVTRPTLSLSVNLSLEMKRQFKDSGNISLRMYRGTSRDWSFPITYTANGIARLNAWKEFVQDNNLKVVDVCVFILKDKFVEVKIFRGEEIDKGEMGDEDGNDQSSQCSFQINIKKYHITNCLWIPSKCARELLTKKKPREAELCVPGREETWTVGLMYCEGEKDGVRVRFQSGWTKFVKENILKVDNSCKFEMIEGDKLRFEVVIEDQNCTLSPEMDNHVDNGNDDEVHEGRYDEFIESRPQKRRRRAPVRLGKKDAGSQGAFASESDLPRNIQSRQPDHLQLCVPCTCYVFGCQREKAADLKD